MASTLVELKEIRTLLVAKIKAALSDSSAPGGKPNKAGPNAVDHERHLERLWAQFYDNEKAIERYEGPTEVVTYADV